MTETKAAPPPRVRPGLRRWAIRSMFVLLPLAMWAAWDYVEARRAAGLVQGIRSKGEPVGPPAAASVRVGEPNAARFYEAAAALVDDRGPGDEVLRQLEVSGEELNPAVLAPLRAWLERNRDAEPLLARATSIENYRPFREEYRRVGDLFSLASLPDMRAIERIQAGDPAGAADAVVQEIRIARAMQAVPMDINMMTAATVLGRAARMVPRVLELRPDLAVEERVRTALEEADRDDILTTLLLAERAFLLNRYWNADRGWFTAQTPDPRRSPGRGLSFLSLLTLRPYTSHLLTGQVQMMSAWLETARKPWPERLGPDGPAAAGLASYQRRFLPTPGESQLEWRDRHARRTKYAGVLLAIVRTSATGVAVDRYRRSHAGALPSDLGQLIPGELRALPVDPFSGKPLLYKPGDGDYVIYSVGPNRRDDGGLGAGTQLRRRWGANQLTEQPPDIGIRVRLAAGAG